MVVVYNDAITGQELSTDSYKIEKTEFFYIIHGKLIKQVEGEYDTGGNAAQEATEEDEGYEKFEVTFPDCAGPEGQNHIDAGVTGKKDLKKKLMDYIKKLAKCEAIPKDVRDDFKAKCQRTLTDEELEEAKASGCTATNAIGKAIHDEYLNNFVNDDFQVVCAAEDYGAEGMLMGFFQYGHKVDDKVRLCIFRHGVLEEKF